MDNTVVKKKFDFACLLIRVCHSISAGAWRYVLENPPDHSVLAARVHICGTAAVWKGGDGKNREHRKDGLLLWRAAVYRLMKSFMPLSRRAFMFSMCTIFAITTAAAPELPTRRYGTADMTSYL